MKVLARLTYEVEVDDEDIFTHYLVNRMTILKQRAELVLAENISKVTASTVEVNNVTLGKLKGVGHGGAGETGLRS